MRLRSILFAAVGLLIAATVYWRVVSYSNERTLSIADVSRSETLRLVDPDFDQRSSPYSGIEIWVTGDVDGASEIWMGDSLLLQVEGRVDERIYRDWYGDECELTYKPGTTRTGALQVRYEYH